MIGNYIFIIKIGNNLPYTISLATEKSTLQKFNLSMIKNKKVDKYINDLKSRATTLDGFDFSKEEIRAKYKVDTSNGVKYLNTVYKMSGKRKNIVNVTLIGSSNILNPDKGSDTSLVHAAYLLDAKKYLFEVKKALKDDGSVKLTWGQNPKKSMLQIKYKDSDGKTAKKKISRGKKQFYDIAALWYLIHWNSVNDIEKKPFLLMKEDWPFEAEYIQKDYGYLVTIKNKDSYKFYLDKDKRINKVIDLRNDLEMSLTKNGFITDTIEENIKYLEKLLMSTN